MGTVSAIKAAADMLANLYSYLKQQGVHDPQLIGMVDELRGKILDAREQEFRLVARVDELEKELMLREMPFGEGFSVYYTEHNGQKAYFCPNCKDGDGKLARLFFNGEHYECRVCETYFLKTGMTKRRPMRSVAAFSS